MFSVAVGSHPPSFRLLFCGTSVRCSGRGVNHSFGVPSCATMAAYRKMPPEGDFTVEMVRLKNGIAGLGWFGNVPVLHRFSGFDLGKVKNVLSKLRMELESQIRKPGNTDSAPNLLLFFHFT